MEIETQRADEGKSRRSRSESKESLASEAAGSDNGGYGAPSPLSRDSKHNHQCLGHRHGSHLHSGDDLLALHKVAKAKDAATKELVAAGVKVNRFCKALEDEAMDQIFDKMEYFQFNADEIVVREGEGSSYFFVPVLGSFELSVAGNTIDKVGAVPFGGIALLFDCPQPSTVSATELSGVWGVKGDIFRIILREHSKRHYAENRQFLDCISAFDGLPPKQKERIGELALFSASFVADQRVITEGEAPTAIRFVKRGQLTISGGGTQTKLRAGDSFGVRDVLYDRPCASRVVADGECELLCVGVNQLKEVLGDDLVACLRRSSILNVLKGLPVISHLSATQQGQIEQVMVSTSYESGQNIEEGLELIIVVDGEISGKKGSSSVTLKRGQWFLDPALVQLEEFSGASPASGQQSAGPELQGLTAGASGCILAKLSKADFVSALKELGLSGIGGSEEAVEYMKKMLLAKKVPIFRDLSQDQIDSVINSMVLKRYSKGAEVFRQGEIGNAFFIIASGEIDMLVNGVFKQSLGTGTCFGDRALLFDKQRFATVQVSSDIAELWAVDRQTFRSLLPENMLAELKHHSMLQDTSVTMKSLKHVRLVGAGAFGSVRLVEHRKTGMRYALKRVRKVDGRVPVAVERECALLREVDYPMVLRMVKTLRTAGSIYILTELITGGELHQQLQKMGVLNRKQAQFYLGSLVLILETLHTQMIVYRDLKPENVMLDSFGYLKLVDFGLAKKLSESERRTFTVCGTLSYIAPEILKEGGYGTEADIWSLGVIFYEFVCGSLPWDSDCDEKLINMITDAAVEFPTRFNDLPAKNLITSMLCKSPDQRIGNGINGWDEIKAHKYFKAGVCGNLFNKIIGRELRPPSVPEAHTYSDERVLTQEVSLSDAEELGDANDAAAEKVLQMFKQFDVNGDGQIDRGELEKVLNALGAFSTEDLDKLMLSADLDHNGGIDLQEFIDYIFSGGADSLGVVADSDIHK